MAVSHSVGVCVRVHNSTFLPLNNTTLVSWSINQTVNILTSSMGGTLDDALGDFGCEHCDKKDNPVYYTCMESISDLPPGYDPGRFFILYPGVFIISPRCTFPDCAFMGGRHLLHLPMLTLLNSRARFVSTLSTIHQADKPRESSDMLLEVFPTTLLFLFLLK